MSDWVTSGCFALGVGCLIIIYRVVTVVGQILNSGAEERTKERQDYMVCFNQMMDRYHVPKEQAIDLADLHRVERTNDRGIDAALEDAKTRANTVTVHPKNREVDPRFSSVDTVAAEIQSVQK